MNEAEVRAAIAQQEEHIKRNTSCNGVYLQSHSWDWFSPKPGVRIEQCFRCKVTRTDEDYQKKIAS